MKPAHHCLLTLQTPIPIAPTSFTRADGTPIGSEPVFGTIAPLGVDAIIGQAVTQPTDAWYDLEPARVSL